MPSYQEKRFLPYSPLQVYQLVADVRRYPEFLPWCQEAVVHRETLEDMSAELAVGHGPFQGRFQSMVHFFPHERIEVIYEKGPLKHLRNEWHFKPLAQPHNGKEISGCWVEFFIDFELQNSLLQFMMQSFFEQISKRMMGAFEERAHQLYDKAS